MGGKTNLALLAALVGAIALPDAVAAQTNGTAMIATDWSLAKARPEPSVRAKVQAMRPATVPRARRQSGIRGSARMTNRTRRGGTAGQVDLAVPF